MFFVVGLGWWMSADTSGADKISGEGQPAARYPSNIEYHYCHSYWKRDILDILVTFRNERWWITSNQSYNCIWINVYCYRYGYFYWDGLSLKRKATVWWDGVVVIACWIWLVWSFGAVAWQNQTTYVPAHQVDLLDWQYASPDMLWIHPWAWLMMMRLE